MSDKVRTLQPQNIRNQLFINGEFVDAEHGGVIDVINPHDGSKITAIAEAKAADVDKAVAAARAAFHDWSNTFVSERGQLIMKLADKLEQHFDEFTELESLDTGHPLKDTRRLDLPRTLLNLRYFGGIADKIDGREVPVEPGFLSIVKRKPVGVVGQIVPWNFPIMFCSWKLGPALAAGNTVVMKPSEITPLSTLRLVDLMNEVGFPARRRQYRPGLWAYCRPAYCRAPGHRQDRLYRFHGDGAQDRPGLRRQPETRLTGDGRQRSQHRV